LTSEKGFKKQNAVKSFIIDSLRQSDQVSMEFLIKDL